MQLQITRPLVLTIWRKYEIKLRERENMRECEEMKYDRASSLSEWVRQNVGFALRVSQL